MSATRSEIEVRDADHFQTGECVRGKAEDTVESD